MASITLRLQIGMPHCRRYDTVARTEMKQLRCKRYILLWIAQSWCRSKHCTWPVGAEWTIARPKFLPGLRCDARWYDQSWVMIVGYKFSHPHPFQYGYRWRIAPCWPSKWKIFKCPFPIRRQTEFLFVAGAYQHWFCPCYIRVAERKQLIVDPRVSAFRPIQGAVNHRWVI